MSQFFAVPGQSLSFDTSLDLRCRSIRIAWKLIPAFILLTQRVFLHVQLSQRLIDLGSNPLILPASYL
jgi:hypothetical protein